ncbi:MAG: acetate--CoA ligase [Chloroflexi bacterium]|nr:acetate--CoA ligase [Chloroflexota bacterium]
MADATGGEFRGLLDAGERVAPVAATRLNAILPDWRTAYEVADADTEAYWARVARELTWIEPWRELRVEDERNHTEWFAGSRCNITQNVLDRHLEGANRTKTALIWVSEEGEERRFTFEELARFVNRFANVLRRAGVQKGDRVCIYMPLTPEGMAAMLACARIGAIHSVVYAGLAATALRSRIEDAGATALIVADQGVRRGKTVDLWSIASEALSGETPVRRVILHRRSPETALPQGAIDLVPALADASDEAEAEPMEASDPLFILYTSGTTGTPKGVVYPHAGYMVGVARNTRIAYNLKPETIYWCTSDIGWIVGHSCIVYGPWINGVTQVVREGAPDYPDPGVVWSIIERYAVTTLFTAPTALRMFMRFGGKYPAKYDLDSLTILICAGEPLNPEAQIWAYRHVMRDRGPVCDNWWQTETGGPTLGTLPADVAKIGRVGRPLPGVRAEVVDREGKPVADGHGGFLVLQNSWPHMLQTIWNNDARYQEYYSLIPGVYTAGDVATRDGDGYFAVLGRADDVLNVAGHRIGTADVESALVSHPAVGEAGVIGIPDAIKGEEIKAFVVLRAGSQPSDALHKQLFEQVRNTLGPIATPKAIDFVPSLPKTRSGKIMRRVLKARELGIDPGDLTTLED